MDLFINYKGCIEDVAKEISGLFGIELKKETNEFGENYYMFRFLDIEFVLYGEHGLEDDCGIVFSEYNYQIQIIKLRSGEKYKSYNDMYDKTAMFLMEKLSKALESNTMLVDNLQKVVSSIDISEMQKNPSDRNIVGSVAYASGK